MNSTVANVPVDAGQPSLAGIGSDLHVTLLGQGVMVTRERFARDLQEGAIHAIFAVSMRLQGTATMTADAAMRRRLDEMVRQLDAVIADLRRHAFGVQDQAGT